MTDTSVVDDQHEGRGDGTRPRPEPEAGTLTVWSDIGCPWATLSLHVLRSAASERGLPLRIDHRAFPLELFNSEPTPKHIIDAEVVAISGLRPDLGWQLWRGPYWTYPVTTLPALEAVQAAKQPLVGGLTASDELDAALRRAFYAESRCISVHSVILDIAAGCEHLDVDALRLALAEGVGRAEVYRDWAQAAANGSGVQGSPQLLAAGGYSTHNPGAMYHWTGAPPAGFPRFERYDSGWAEELLDLLDSTAVPAAAGPTGTAPAP